MKLKRGLQSGGDAMHQSRDIIQSGVRINLAHPSFRLSGTVHDARQKVLCFDGEESLVEIGPGF